jgi:hypothetical protein
VAKYEHQAGKILQVQSKGLALLCPLMLRGPQTLGELKTNSHRLYPFDDLEDVQYMLQRLAEHEPALLMSLPRQPGQKEDRFAHLLCGEPDIPEPVARPGGTPVDDSLMERIESLESQLEQLRIEVDRLRSLLESKD